MNPGTVTVETVTIFGMQRGSAAIHMNRLFLNFCSDVLGARPKATRVHGRQAGPCAKGRPI